MTREEAEEDFLNSEAHVYLGQAELNGVAVFAIFDGIGEPLAWVRCTDDIRPLVEWAFRHDLTPETLH